MSESKFEQPAKVSPIDIDELLALDASRRIVGVSGGLIPIEELEPKSWDFTAPTLESKRNDTYEERTLLNSSDTFAKLFYDRYPPLKGVPLDGLLIAGSSVGQFIQSDGVSTNWTASDVDIFVYGKESPDKRVERFIHELDEASHQRGKNGLKATLENLLRTMTDDENRLFKTPINNLKSALSGSKKRTYNVNTIHDAIRVCKVVLQHLENAIFTQTDACMSMCAPGVVTAISWAKVVNLALQFGIPMQYELPTVETVRTSGSITIKHKYTKIQVVLRHYATKSEILHGFDLGASAAGFDGQHVRLTELARFAYEYGYNIVDTTRRSTTYEARLSKYIDRGFDLILPRLNIKSLSRRNLKYNLVEVADLPLMPFAYNRIEGNRIFFERFVKNMGAWSDYDISDEIDCGGFSVAYMNLRSLVNGKKNFIYTSEGYGCLTSLDVLHKPPHLTLHMIQRLYDEFRLTVWRESRLNIRCLDNYVPVVPTVEIATDACKGDEAANAALDIAFKKQREEATHLWKKEIRDADHRILPWVTENPGGQKSPLTGSLNPIIEDPKMWYGNYLA